jgi:hypothetical protein
MRVERIMGRFDQKQIGRPMNRDFAGRINLANQAT